MEFYGSVLNLPIFTMAKNSGTALEGVLITDTTPHQVHLVKLPSRIQVMAGFLGTSTGSAWEMYGKCMGFWVFFDFSGLLVAPVWRFSTSLQGD